MSRPWMPGDVVTGTVNGRANVRLVAGWSKYNPRLRWCELSPRWADGDDDECWFLPVQVTNIRPLVVIDPHDAIRVERLQDLYIAAEAKGLSGLSMQAALTEFANPTPPKPPEPQGLGAVVEDDQGEQWTRVRNRPPRSACWLRDASAVSPLSYADVAAVKVLNEGVTP